MAGSASADEKYSLQAPLAPGQLTETRAILEIEGHLRLNPDGTSVTQVPLKVQGELLYDEKVLSTDELSSRPRTGRYYREAGANIQIAETTVTPKLGEDRRLIVALRDGNTAPVFSPLGPLTREELELVQVPGNTLLLPALLPQKEVAVGETWTPASDVLAALFGIDHLTKTEVESTLRKVQDNTAMMEMNGKLVGVVAGAQTEIELAAKYNLDMQQHQITWFAMAARERRAVGHAEPGYEVKMRLRVATKRIEQSPELSADALAGLPLEYNEAAQLLQLASTEGGFQLAHDRDWRVMIDRHDVTVMRLVDDGDLIAQCNVSKLPALAKGEQLTLEGFQQDIRKALGKNFAQFVEASQSVSDEGLRVLRVVAAGKVSELPIQWNYYHISDSEGRRTSLVFTFEQSLLERFAERDQILISSFRFNEASESQKATAQSKNSEQRR